MNIIVYTKTGCPWGIDVLRFLSSHNIPFEERNMTDNEIYKAEALEKSGMFKCPTLDIDGHILADSDVETMQAYLESLKK